MQAPTETTTTSTATTVMTTATTTVAATVETTSVSVGLSVSWNGKCFSLEVSPDSTVADLKQHMETLTGVLAKRQKLVGLKFLGKPAADECAIGSLGLKDRQKVMLIGSVEVAVAPDPADLPDVLDDLDFDHWPDMHDDQNQTALQLALKRVQNITLMNGLREHKKLCVLDLDYTLFDIGDMKTSTGHITHLKRPYLDDFLARVFVHYDIAIWSQTSWRWLEVKLTELGLLAHPRYHISFVLDRTSMFEVTSKTRDGSLRKHEVKALAVIWNVLNQYGPHNTVHVDDLGRNFVMNPKNGIKVSAYKNSSTSRNSDNELVLLADFLEFIASASDVTEQNLGDWKKTLRRRR